MCCKPTTGNPLCFLFLCSFLFFSLFFSWIIVYDGLQMRVYYRHVGGVYTTDFPDHPSYYFNFTGYDMPSDVTMQATKVKVLNYNESVEIIFQGTNVQYTPEDHPLHLHGYTFYVIGSGYGVFDNETDPQGFNLVDPPERNTVTVPQNGWVALRFVANNPGGCILQDYTSIL